MEPEVLPKQLLSPSRHAKKQTMEIFGEPERRPRSGEDRPFHSYTMTKAIQEGCT